MVRQDRKLFVSLHRGLLVEFVFSVLSELWYWSKHADLYLSKFSESKPDGFKKVFVN